MKVIKTGAIKFPSVTMAIQSIIKRSYNTKKGIKPFGEIAKQLDCKVPHVNYAYKKLVTAGIIPDCYNGKRGFSRTWEAV